MVSEKVFDKSQVPEPICDAEPQYLELYWKAWECAFNHILTTPGAPQSSYIDEGMDPNKIWIWDTCFMALYCKYAPHYFPGIESLNNFYLPLYKGVKIPLKIEHLDNPPLFAWIEFEYFKFTSDLERLKWILLDEKFLQKHYDFIENSKRFRKKKHGTIPTMAKKHRYGYKWLATPSGMDNTPRGRGKYFSILWLDLLAQQALAAENIAKISRILNNSEIAEEFQNKYEEMKKLANRFYWNEIDGIYYDIKKENPNEQVKVKTPAAYWLMLAGFCNRHQAEKLKEKSLDPRCFGGEIPWPSVSRDDPDYNPRGMYWRGGVWLPLAYMATKALERYDYYEEADSTAETLLNHMVRTYKEYAPHTIWEVYSPSEPKPATYKRDKEKFTPEFCGWSALGPISMFIENVLGFHSVNALEKKVDWRLHRKERHGIRRLRFGGVLTNIIYEAGKVNIVSNEPYLLTINDNNFKINAGKQVIEVASIK